MAQNLESGNSIHLRRNQRPRRKIIPLAGSDRGPLQSPPAPQVPPLSTRPLLVVTWVPEHKPLSRDPRAQFDRLFGTAPAPKQPINPRLAFHGLFGETEVPEEKVRTIDDVAPVAFPFCPHEVRLTKDEYLFETSYKSRPYCRKMDGRVRFTNPKSFECLRCHPVCKHGRKLNETEIETGVRYSANCPGCVGKITNIAALEQFLKNQRLTHGEGMSLREGQFQTSYGLWISKSGKRYQVSGGSDKMEKLDAAHVEITDDGPEGNGREGGVAAVFTGDQRDREGWGPDTILDDDFKSWAVDAEGDPLSTVASETVKAFEDARAESTREELAPPKYEIKKSERGGWNLFEDGKEISYHLTHRDAKQAFAELTELVVLDFKKVPEPDEIKIEHEITDVLSSIDSPEGPEKLKGMKDQRVNPKAWTNTETTKMKDEITDEIDQTEALVAREVYPEDSENE
jgi:hypothetical protein